MVVELWDRKSGQYIGVVFRGQLGVPELSIDDPVQKERVKEILFNTSELQGDLDLVWSQQPELGPAHKSVDRGSAAWLALVAVLYLHPQGFRAKLDTRDLPWEASV